MATVQIVAICEAFKNNFVKFILFTFYSNVSRPGVTNLFVIAGDFVSYC